MTDTPTLPLLLEDARADLIRYIGAHSGWLARFEAPEDLWQGVCLRALAAADSFRYEGRKPFLSWIHQTARSHLADRRSYWSALKRGSAQVMRLTAAGDGTPDPRAVLEPPGTRTGPSTFASRREQVALAIKALAVLSTRDRDLIRMESEGVESDEQARRLDLSGAALRQARARAMTRFRKAYALVSRAAPRSGPTSTGP